MIFIKAQRIKWLRQIPRMDQGRPTGLETYGNWTNRGRPSQRWQEDVMEDLKKLEVKN
jgi:hypothetical protein